MRLAQKKDKDLVIDILSESFITNPSVLSVIKNDKNKAKQLRELARYAFYRGFRREGVYISDDNSGVAICYKYNIKKESIYDYISQVRLVLKCIGISRVFKVLKRESYIKKHRLASGEFLYFWFFGVSNNGRGKGSAIDLKNGIMEISKQKQLPIYLETSVEKNKNVYQRYGFEVYHTMENTKEDHTLWFMEREVYQ